VMVAHSSVQYLWQFAILCSSCLMRSSWLAYFGRSTSLFWPHTTRCRPLWCRQT